MKPGARHLAPGRKPHSWTKGRCWLSQQRATSGVETASLLLPCLTATTHLARQFSSSPTQATGLGSLTDRREGSTRGLNKPAAPGSGRVRIATFIDQIDLSIWFFPMDDEYCTQTVCIHTPHASWCHHRAQASDRAGCVFPTVCKNGESRSACRSRPRIVGMSTDDARVENSFFPERGMMAGRKRATLMDSAS